MNFDHQTLRDADVISEDDDFLLLSLPSPEPNSLTLCLAKETGGELHQVGGRSITLRWDPQVDEMDDDLTPAFDLLKGALET